MLCSRILLPLDLSWMTLFPVGIKILCSRICMCSTYWLNITWVITAETTCFIQNCTFVFHLKNNIPQNSQLAIHNHRLHGFCPCYTNYSVLAFQFSGQACQLLLFYRPILWRIWCLINSVSVNREHCLWPGLPRTRWFHHNISIWVPLRLQYGIQLCRVYKLCHHAMDWVWQKSNPCEWTKLKMYVVCWGFMSFTKT